eukprot:gene9296-6842_t
MAEAGDAGAGEGAVVETALAALRALPPPERAWRRHVRAFGVALEVTIAGACFEVVLERRDLKRCVPSRVCLWAGAGGGVV